MWWLLLLSHRKKVLTLTAPSGQGLSMCRFCGRKHPERAHTKTYNYWLIGDSKLSIDVSVAVLALCQICRLFQSVAPLKKLMEENGSMGISNTFKGYIFFEKGWLTHI